MSPTILLIEDNAQNRYLTTFLLEKRGYRVIPAPDGSSGIALAEKICPALILLDIQLPKMDGYVVARTIRSIVLLREIPIVAVTSFAMVGDREKCLDAGCNGFIEKPINPETFVSEIEHFLPSPDRGD